MDGHKIKMFRLLNGMKQEQVARAVGISQQLYSNIERGRQPVRDKDCIRRIEHALGLDDQEGGENG